MGSGTESVSSQLIFLAKFFKCVQGVQRFARAQRVGVEPASAASTALGGGASAAGGGCEQVYLRAAGVLLRLQRGQRVARVVDHAAGMPASRATWMP